jgi:hypothetical protein
MISTSRTQKRGRSERTVIARFGWLVFLLTAALSLASAMPSLAQTAAPSQTTGSSWEIDAGGGLGQSAGGALTSTMAVAGLGNGPLFTAPGSVAPLVQSVQTWFLSSGSALLMPAIQPLSVRLNGGPVQMPSALGHRQGGIGARVTRWVSPRVGFEVAVSYAAGAPTQLCGTTLSSIEQSRASFATAFSALFAASPASYGAATATAATSSTVKSGGQLLVTGALVVTKGTGRLRPYLTLGAGQRRTIGSMQTVALTGSYQFVTPGGAPIRETDSVAMRYASGHTVVAEVGVGFRQLVTAHSGFRVDARGLVGTFGDQLSIDISPSSRMGSPPGFFVQNPPTSNGTIVFSNTPTQQTSLSGSPVTNLTTATGTGVHWTWLATVSWFWRL